MKTEIAPNTSECSGMEDFFWDEHIEQVKAKLWAFVLVSLPATAFIFAVFCIVARAGR